MSSLFDTVIGQARAVSMLQAALIDPVPAYLFVGPSGAGTRNAARLFAAGLLNDKNNDQERHQRLATAEEHPDLVIVDRSGAFVTAEQARDIVRTASTSPIEGDRKVIVVTDLHLIRDAGPMLLKSIEEPPPSTFFILLADEISSDLVTIASRCLQIEFVSIPADELEKLLIKEGTDPGRARFASQISDGSIDRARILASDDGALNRWNAWSQIREKLNGSGGNAAIAADLVLELIDSSAGPMEDKHSEERLALDERAERFGERGLGRAILEDRHKRELRRLRTDEFLMGFSAIGAAIREEVSDQVIDSEKAIRSLTAIQKASQNLRRNPNEKLMTQHLMLELSDGAQGGN